MLHTQTQCTSMHVHGLTTGQKTVENQDWAVGRRAVTGCGPWSVGRGPRAAAGPRAVAIPWAVAGCPGPLGRRGPLGRGPAFSKTQYPSANHASSKPVQIPLLSLEAEACH